MVCDNLWWLLVKHSGWRINLARQMRLDAVGVVVGDGCEEDW